MKDMSRYHLRLARPKFEKAMLVDPTRGPEISGFLATLDTKFGEQVGGLWLKLSEVDRMSDEPQTSLLLPSEDQTQGGLEPTTPLINVRCRGKKLDMLIMVGVRVDEDADKPRYVTCRYRFNKSPPERVAFTTGTDGETLFFPDPRTWMTRLMDASTSTVTFEIPVRRTRPQIFAFNLEASEKALQHIVRECPK